ncbi:thiamine diphosphate-binding protein [Aspergillus varians]
MEITNSSDSSKVDLAEYLFTRLHQVGIRTVHGVPGDFNLVSLDCIKPAGLHWAGNANNLNAGYAADGYARIKGISALVTTFGVGELSAVNAMAGAYADKVPVIHIVGTPETSAQNKGLNIRHSLGDGNFRRFALLYQQFTCAQANLADPATAPAMIDRVIRVCMQESRPGYIELPADMAKAQVSSLGLKNNIDPSFSPNHPDTESSIFDAVFEHLDQAKMPLIIVDGFTPRYNLLSEADELISATGWPTYVTPFGKGSVNETHPNFHGVFTGKAAGEDDAHLNWAQKADLVIRFGPLDADTNTYGFTTLTDRSKTIDIHRTCINIAGRVVQADTKPLLRNVLDKLDTPLYRYRYILYPHPYPYADLRGPRERLNALTVPPAPIPCPDEPLDQDHFWLWMSTFLRPHDLVITETGPSYIGAPKGLVLPSDTVMINSALWPSVGYALGAAVGAAQAQRDLVMQHRDKPCGRTILFTGDGNFQMTAQAVSDILRSRLDVIIFLVNNDGCTVERDIHGMEAGYNDIQPWNYLDAPRFFGAPVGDAGYPVVTKRVVDWGELLDVLSDDEVKAGRGLCMVEVVMGGRMRQGI